MIKLTEEYINSTAPNQSAIQNGWGLVRKNSFVKRNVSSDEAVIFGECKGSGASNYTTSVDFKNPESPVFRCSCPSRQFPCKHALGLMYAYVSGKEFAKDELPADIVEKREKAEKREEKKASVEAKPKKVNKSALVKKIQAQKEGLELLEKITYNIAQSGLGTMSSKSLKILEDQAKQLGNYYIPGAQTAVREFILLFKEVENTEKVHTEAMDCLTRLYSLCKKGKEYLDKRLNDPEMSLDASSTLDEWLGHVWQLSELKELGLVQQDIELAQLSFHSYAQEARQEYVDTGIWLNLKTGQVVESRNYRPFKAAKYIREEDSFYSILQTPELFIYPGDMNPRVRWEGMSVREFQMSDFQIIKSHAQKTYPEVTKLVKNQIKNPLSGKYPTALLHYTRIGRIDGNYVMEDAGGQRMILLDNPRGFEPPSVHMLSLMSRENLQGQVALVRFHNDMDAKRLYVQPLSIITDDSMIRLIY